MHRIFTFRKFCRISYIKRERKKVCTHRKNYFMLRKITNVKTYCKTYIKSDFYGLMTYIFVFYTKFYILNQYVCNYLYCKRNLFRKRS